MIKLNICAARIPGITHEQYLAHLVDNHARLVLSQEPVVRYLKAYLQQHVFDGAYGDTAPVWRYDSVSHIFTGSIADQIAATSQPEYHDYIAPDEARFADRSSAMFLNFTELPLALPTVGMSRYRLFYYAKGAAALTPAVLHATWAAAHANLVRKDFRLFTAVRKAVLNLRVAGPGPAGAYDLMYELGFVGLADVPVMCELLAALLADVGATIDLGSAFFLLAQTHAVRGSLD